MPREQKRLYFELGKRLREYTLGFYVVEHAEIDALRHVVLIGGVVEELLFRGYAIARLAAWTGRPWLAGALATLLFALAHVPLWGLAASLALLVSGAVGTLVYLWRRDLALVAIAHVITDGAGLLFVDS